MHFRSGDRHRMEDPQMKKIGTSIIISIIISVIIATGLVGSVSLLVSSKAITKESNDKLQSMAKQYRNDMDTSFEKYQTIVGGVAQYISSSYDGKRILDTEYDIEYMKGISEYLKIINQEYGEDILSIYAYVHPDKIKQIIGAKYCNGEFVDNTTEDDYLEYFSDQATWQWYAATKANKAPTWIKPYYDSVTSENCMTYGYPIYQDDELVAMVGIDIKFDKFSDMVNSISAYKTGHASLVDSDQHYIVDETYSVNENIVSAGYTKLSEAVEKNDSGIEQVTDTNGIKSYVSYAKLNNGFDVLILVPVSEVNESSTQVLMYGGIIALIVCILSAVLAIIIGNKISKPITQVSLDLQLMENGDFTGTKYKPYIKNKNETGKLARALDSVQKSMKETVGMVSNSGEDIAGAVVQLEDVINSLVDRVAGISAISEQLAASMEETAATAESLSTTSDNIAIHIENMNKKNQEGKVTIKGISDRANILKDDAEQATRVVDEITRSTENKLKSAIEESKRVEQIDQLTAAILDIADETALLSLNASIEAAKAGESGKGFAVVADEIRKLAETSEATAIQIQKITKDVTDSVENLCNSSSEVLEFISNNVKDTNKKLVETSEQYNNDAGDMQRLLNEFSEIATGISEEMSMIIHAFEELKNATAEGAKGTTTVAEDAEAVAENTGKVQNEASRLKVTSEKLSSVIERFNV